MSLEALGDTDGALAAYRRYLDHAGADTARKSEGKRRVEALAGAGTKGQPPATP